MTSFTPDYYGKHSYGPAADIIPITPDDVNDLEYGTSAILATTAGVIACYTEGAGSGTVRTFPIAASQVIPVAITRVLSTGTTATGIHGLVVY